MRVVCERHAGGVRRREVFDLAYDANAADPDYRTMLAAIETGKKQAYEYPEADMPGFAGHRREP